MATRIPFEVRDLLRHAYPTGDYSDTSAHLALIEAARVEDRTYEVVGELQHVAGLVPLLGVPVDGETCDYVHVARYLVLPPPDVLAALRRKEIPPTQVHFEYVGLGFLLISLLGPYASYLPVDARPDRPPSGEELRGAQSKVQAALEHAGVELLPWSVLNARLDWMKPARVGNRPYVATVHLCLFRRLF